MGVADRDYMRDIPVYRDTARHRTAPPVVALAAAASLVAGLFVLRAPLHLVRSGNHTTVLLPGRHTFPLAGPRQVQAGAIMTEHGRLAAGTAGTVVVLARWNGGAWMRLASANSGGDGSYLVSFPLDQPGLVDLRLELPDGAEGVTQIRVSGAPSAPTA